MRRTSSSAVTGSSTTRLPVRTSQPHQRPVPAPTTISSVQNRVLKYRANSGLAASMPAVQAYHEVYHQCSAVNSTTAREPHKQDFQPPIQSAGPYRSFAGALACTRTEDGVAIVPLPS